MDDKKAIRERRWKKFQDAQGYTELTGGAL